MNIALQIISFLLLLFCLAVFSHILYLFNVIPRFAHLSGLLGAAAFILYLFTGLRLEDPASQSVIRNFIRVNALSDNEVLILLSVFLMTALVALVRLGMSSKTLLFDSDSESIIDIYEVAGRKERYLGATSLSTPLKVRLRSGQRRFQYRAPSFELAEREASIDSSFSNFVSSGAERMIVELDAVATFDLLNLHSDDEFFGQPIDGLEYPDELQNLPQTTLVFGIKSSSPTPLWIQSLFVKVTDVRRLEEYTFPYFGEGAPGPDKIHGFVRLEPKPGLYEVSIPKISGSKLGRGIDPSVYHIHAFCDPGYQYDIALEASWTDLDNRRGLSRYSFDEPLRLDFPMLTPWEDAIKDVQNLRILFYPLVDSLIDHIQELQPVPKYNILLTGLSEGWPPREFKHTSQISEQDEGIITDLVGQITLKRPRNFFIIDGKKMLLQDAKRLDRAQLIDDASRIQDIEIAYDVIATQRGLSVG